MVNLVLLAVLAGFALWAYPRLPGRIPTHFGIGGEPDAWSQRSVASWFLLPAIGAFLTLLMVFVAALVGRKPEYVNMPAKTKLLQLPREEQLPVLREVQLFVMRMNAIMLLSFLAIQWGSWRAALGLSSRGALLASMVLLLLLALPGLTLAVIINTTSAIKEAHRRATLRGTLRSLSILLALVLIPLARRGSDPAPRRSRPEAARPDQRAPARRGSDPAASGRGLHPQIGHDLLIARVRMERP